MLDKMLDKELIRLSQSNTYPFHMPGHKRRPLELGNPYAIDITEIENFDNLHGANGIIMEAQQRAADLYGSKRCFFLVNGSTVGLLAAISAGARKGAKVIVARNCHKAVYHGLLLRELIPAYVYPEFTDMGMQGQITVEQLEQKIRENPDAEAVIITSPTYDGIVSDIKAIAELVHKNGMLLIVDEAHGAHLGFEERLPENAVSLGADAVIMSLHKTLPSFTQTALLHICSDRIDAKQVEKYLGIYETSSPSYLFMAGMEVCVRYISEEKDRIFPEYMDMLDDFYREIKVLKKLKVIEGGPEYDKTKILISTDGSSIDGPGLQEILLDKYQIQLEMSASNYVLALSSVMDTREGFDRLRDALLEIDGSLSEKAVKQNCCRDIYKEMERVIEIHQANELELEEIPLEKAEKQICGEFISKYPPGIPIIVPGERITKDFLRIVREESLTEAGRIKIVNPS